MSKSAGTSPVPSSDRLLFGEIFIRFPVGYVNS